MKKLLINATQPEETRIAITKNDKLFDLDIENVDREQKKANIYKAKISRIEPSLNAIFVNYGEQKNGFLPFKETSPEYFLKPFNEDEENPPINELFEVGQEIIVQINKEERGTKGAALTTFLTLAGCFIVLMPNNPNAGGISRRIEGDDRQKLKNIFNSLNIPGDMGVIIRTAGVDRSVEEIQWDLDLLVNLWNAIKEANNLGPAPFLIHRESDVLTRAIRDYLRDDITGIITDTKDAFDNIKRQLTLLRPDFLDRLSLHTKKVPLFSDKSIENQIENAFKRELRLPSGGSIVIDTTEALTSIDINSAKATKSGNIEDTALNTNLEAAQEIAIQLKLRDVGGLIVIDFIDMQQPQNQRQVEQQLADDLTADRAKIQMTRISKFGLIEISRQRLRPSLGESSTITCPRCEGQGIIRSTASLGLSILRLVEEEANKDKTNEIRVQLPIPVATFILNEKRQTVCDIENKLDVKIVLIPNSNLETPHYNIQRIYGEVYSTSRQSYQLIEPKLDEVIEHAQTSKAAMQQPAVKSVQLPKAPQRPSPQQRRKEPAREHQKVTKTPIAKESLFKRFIKAVFNTEEQQKPVDTKEHSKHVPQKQNVQARTVQQDSKSNRFSQNQDKRQQQRPDNKKRPQQERQNRSGYNRNAPNASNKNRQQQNRNASKYRQNDPNKTNIHRSEEVVDITLLKQKRLNEEKQALRKSDQKLVANSDSMQKVDLKQQDQIKPKSKISPMVKDILTRCQTLTNTTSQQVETNVKSTNAQKYLKIEVVELLLSEKDKLEQINTRKPAQVTKSEQKDSKRQPSSDSNRNRKPIKILNHHCAIDPTQQSFVSTTKIRTKTHKSGPNTHKSKATSASFLKHSIAMNPAQQTFINESSQAQPINTNKKGPHLKTESKEQRPVIIKSEEKIINIALTPNETIKADKNNAQIEPIVEHKIASVESKQKASSQKQADIIETNDSNTIDITINEPNENEHGSPAVIIIAEDNNQKSEEKLINEKTEDNSVRSVNKEEMIAISIEIEPENLKSTTNDYNQTDDQKNQSSQPRRKRSPYTRVKSNSSKPKSTDKDDN